MDAIPKSLGVTLTDYHSLIKHANTASYVQRTVPYIKDLTQAIDIGKKLGSKARD
jgi:hypothetical protein